MTLFDRLVEASGLSPLFAKNSLARALSRISAKPETLTRAQLKAALPELEKVLRIFLDEEDRKARMLKIRELTWEP